MGYHTHFPPVSGRRCWVAARLYVTVQGCRLTLDDGAGLPPVLGDSAGFRLSNCDSAGMTRRDRNGVRHGLAYEARFVCSLREDIVFTL